MLFPQVIFRLDGMSRTHGFIKPFPSFKWCRFSLASSGTAPVIDAGEIVAAYSEAAIPEPDIL